MARAQTCAMMQTRERPSRVALYMTSFAGNPEGSNSRALGSRTELLRYDGQLLRYDGRLLRYDGFECPRHGMAIRLAQTKKKH